MAYDPTRSRISENTLAAFLASDIEGELQTVPGIGPSAEEKLAKHGVTTTWQLIGNFLACKDKDMTVQEHHDAMWYFLQEVGVSSCRSGIVHALSEKCNILFPNMFRESFDNDAATDHDSDS
jgi:hypothetical protein